MSFLAKLLGKRRQQSGANASTKQIEREGKDVVAELRLEFFQNVVSEDIERLREFLGPEAFSQLTIIDMEIPSAGEIILSETHGVTLKTIALNLRRFVTQLDAEIGSEVRSKSHEGPSIILGFYPAVRRTG